METGKRRDRTESCGEQRWQANGDKLRVNSSSKQGWKSCEGESNGSNVSRTGSDRLAGVQVAQRIFRQSTGHVRRQAKQQGEQHVERTDHLTGTDGGAVEHGERAVKKGQAMARRGPAEKRAMTHRLKAEAPVQRLCAELDCPSRSYNNQTGNRDDND